MEFFIRAYKNYANFSGRDTRQQFWMFYLFYVIASIILNVIDSVIDTGGLLAGIFSLASFLPAISITTRRLHDIGKSGWWQLIVLIPLIGLIVLIVFMVKEGVVGDNQFGNDPRNGEINV